MANALYPLWKQGVATAAANTSLASANIRVALVDTGTYTYSAAHQFYSSLTGVATVNGAATTASTSQPALAGKSVSAAGVFDANNLTFTAVTNGSVTCEAIVIYIDSGVAATSPLLAYMDTGITNMPVTPNGGDVVITWNASGIFAL